MTKFLRNLKVREKLLALITVVLVAQVVAMGFSLLLLNRVKIGGGPYNRITDHRQNIERLVRLQGNLNNLRMQLLELAVETNQDRKATMAGEFRATAALVSNEFAELTQVASPEIAVSIADASRTWHAAMETNEQVVIPMILGGRSTQAIQQLLGVQGQRYRRFSNQVESAVDVLRFEIEALEVETSNVVQRNFAIAVFLAGSSMVLVIGFALWVTRLITQPLTEVIRLSDRIAEGDLSHEAILQRGKDEIGQLSTAFNRMLEMLRRLEGNAKALAAGDFTVSVADKGDLADSFREMLTNLRQIMEQVSVTAAEINAAAAELHAGSLQQQRGASQQTAAVEETRKTINSLMEAAQEIATRADGVFANAESTLNNNRLIASKITELSEHTKRIAEILEVIKEIATKSDLLALNAALEGVKAGEAGRGFSLVATQMQRLAENVMTSVNDIKDMTTDIRETTSASVMVTEEGTRLAKLTNEAAAQIAKIIKQQESATEQVLVSMDDVRRVAKESEAGTTQVMQTTTGLKDLAERLEELLARFRFETEESEQEEQEEESEEPLEVASGA